MFGEGNCDGRYTSVGSKVRDANIHRHSRGLGGGTGARAPQTGNLRRNIRAGPCNLLAGHPQPRSPFRRSIFRRGENDASLLSTDLSVPLRKRENVRWFPSAASAEAAGFRPCRRCRPHTSPGTPAWLGTSSVVSRALKLIFNGDLDEGDVEGLAGHVGLGARHLRRLFVQHLGASPVRVAQTRRIHFARSLIEETELPITKIAFYSGFRSIRQFNHAMRAAFDQSPSELRRSYETPKTHGHKGGIVLFVAYRPPFDWKAMVNFLGRSATPGVEVVETNSYRRTIEIEGESGEIEIRADKAEPRLRVEVKLESHEHLLQVMERVRRIFDLGADPLQIASHLSRYPRLKHLLDERPGLRVPGVWDGFEFSMRTVLDHQLVARDETAVVRR